MSIAAPGSSRARGCAPLARLLPRSCHAGHRKPVARGDRRTLHLRAAAIHRDPGRRAGGADVVHPAHRRLAACRARGVGVRRRLVCRWRAAGAAGAGAFAGRDVRPAAAGRGARAAGFGGRRADGRPAGGARLQRRRCRRLRPADRRGRSRQPGRGFSGRRARVPRGAGGAAEGAGPRRAGDGNAADAAGAADLRPGPLSGGGRLAGAPSG